MFFLPNRIFCLFLYVILIKGFCLLTKHNKQKEKMSDSSETEKYSMQDIYYSMWIKVLFLILYTIFWGLDSEAEVVPQFHEFVSVKGEKYIPMSGITSLTVDDNGFIWGASRIGILRATTQNVSLYDLPVSTSDVMQMKVAYNKGVLVAASQNGQIFRYDRIKDRFELWFSISDILQKKDWISNIVIDGKGKLWISTSIGIFLYQDGKIDRYHPELRGYSYIIRCGHSDMFALADDHIYIISGEDHKLHKMPGTFGQYISNAAFDKYLDRILMGTYQGELWEYSLRNETISHKESNEIPGLIIRSVLVVDSNTYMLGMEGGGIMVLNSSDNRVVEKIKEDVDNPASLKGNSVFAMITDLQGRLWVATTSAGLQYSDIDGEDAFRIQHRHNASSSLHNNEINYLLTDKEGKLWAATNDGISIRDSMKGPWRQLYGKQQLSFLSLAQDMEGFIYASTYGHGVYVLNPKNYSQLNHLTEKEADIFGKGAYVFASFTDSDGDIWFGGVKGDIICYSPATHTSKKYESHPVFCFAEQEKGKILTGGGDGLILIEKDSGKTETFLTDNVVQQILVDGSTWWICSSGNGVIRMDRETGKNTRLTVNEGLHSNFTRSIIKENGKLWIGTALGMSCYETKEGKMLPLPGKDILTSDAFRENSSCKLEDGKLAFGTDNGIVTFFPEKILDYKSQGKIFFSDIKVSGQSIRNVYEDELTMPIDSLMKLELKYPNDSFTLSLLALGNVGSNVMYSWKLDGIDKDWTDLSPVSSINYTKLAPSAYTLNVRMYDGGIVSERSLSINVQPPFWKKLWFRVIFLISILALIALIVRHYYLGMLRRHAFEKLLLTLQMSQNAPHYSLPYIGEENIPKSDDAISDEYQEYETIDKKVVLHSTENDDENAEGNIIDDEFLSKAMECVKNNISNELFGKGEFASAMMISQSLLYKKLKAITDMSVVEFIRSIRLNHAMTLLTSGKYNVTEVSEMCGFSSSAYFSRVFKENFGKAPSEILKK